MIGSIFRAYRSAYSGLPREIWALSIALFINRFGTMVLPFLALYLTEELDFSEGAAGRLISVYGFGAIIGAYLSGRLIEWVGSVRLQILLLLGSVPVFLVLPFCETWVVLVIALIVLSIFSEGVRPANATAIAQYSPPDKQTRAFALQRMALNLGVSFGPVIGGLLATISFFWLFVVDSATTLLCAVALLFMLGFPKSPGVQSDQQGEPGQGDATSDESDDSYVQSLPGPASDRYFIVYLALTLLTSLVFFQFYTTYPMYLRDACGISKPQFGLICAVNTVLIVFFEMVLVDYAGRWPLMKTIGWGCALTCFGFGMLPFGSAVWFVVLSMIVLTAGEMLSMPLSSGWVAQRSQGKNQGMYMGWYTMTYSIAFVIGPTLGGLIYEVDRDLIWYFSLAIGVVVLAGYYLLDKRIREEPSTEVPTDSDVEKSPVQQPAESGDFTETPESALT